MGTESALNKEEAPERLPQRAQTLWPRSFKHQGLEITTPKDGTSAPAWPPETAGEPWGPHMPPRHGKSGLPKETLHRVAVDTANIPCHDHRKQTIFQ